MKERSSIQTNNLWSSSQQEQLINTLSESALISATDIKGNIVFANESFAALSGYSEQELIGQNHRILNSGKQPNQLFVDMWKSISNGETWKGEICNKKKNGNFYWVQTTIIPFKDNHGKIEKYISIRHDITQVKENEDALDTYKAHFTISHDLRCVMNAQGKFDNINSIFISILGFTREHLLKTSFFELIHPADVESSKGEIKKLSDTTSTIEFRNRIKTVGGSYRWVTWNATSNTTTGKIYATAKDHTDTQNTEVFLQKTFQFIALNYGENYFHSLCEFLTVELDVKYAFVGYYINEQRAIKSNAFYCDGKSLPPLTYSVKDTPCDVVISQQYCMYSDDVQKSFPKDKDLVTLGVKSYMGIPLLSESGESIGIISAMHEKPMTNVVEKEKIFKMVAKRTEGELQQQMIQQKIIESEKQKKDIIDAIPDIIFIVDKDGRYIDCLADNDDLLIEPWAILKNKTKHDILPKPVADYILKKIKTAMRTNKVQVAEYSLTINQETNYYESRIIKTGRNTAMQIIRDITDVKIAVGSVIKSEQKFHSLFNTASDGIFIVDKKTASILEVNKTGAQKLGYQPKELTGKKIATLYPKEVQKNFREKIKILSAQGSIVFETQQLKKDGTLVNVEISSTAFRYADRDVFQSFVRDISIRKETEKRQAIAFKIADIASRRLVSLAPLCELVHQELATVVRAPNLIIALIDDAKTIVKFPYFSGSNYTEMVFEIMHGDTKVEAEREFDKNRLIEQVCLSSKTLYIKDYAQSDNNKIKRDFKKNTALKSWLGIPLKSEGKTIGVLALQEFNARNVYSKKDIHFMEFIASQIGGVIEKQNMFSAIYESEFHYKSMIENSSDISLLISDKKTVTYISSSVKKVLGFESTEIIGKEITSLLRKDDRPIVLAQIEKSLQSSNHSFKLEVNTKHKNGEWLIIAVSGSRKLNAKGKHELVINAHDITKSKAYEQRINNSNIQLKFTHRLFERVLHNDDISTVLKVALRGIRQNIKNCVRASISLFDFDINEAFFIANDSINNSKINIDTRVNLKENFRSLATLKRGTPFYCRDVRNIQRKSLSDIALLDEEVVSYFVYPLMDEGELIGSINIGSNIADFMHADNKSMIEEHAYNICIAIIYSNLYKNLQKSENELNRLLHNIDEAVIQIDKSGTIQYINPKAKHYFNVSSEKLVNVGIEQLLDYNPSVYTNCIEYLLDIGRQPASYRQIVLPYSQANTKWGLLNITILTEKKQFSGAIILVTDITDSILKEEIRRKTIIEGEENERKRLAHDLHDGLGQTIAAANMYVNSLEHKLKNKLTKNEWGQLVKARELVNKAVLETRTISHNIMPRSLQEFGLSQTLAELSSNISVIHEKIKTNFHSVLNGKRFENDIELGIYRATQEIINNAIKHSQANTLDIKLEYKSGYLILITIDDGVGISETKSGNGLGLGSLKNRIEVLNGTLEIFSAPNEGTKTKIKIPTKILDND